MCAWLHFEKVARRPLFCLLLISQTKMEPSSVHPANKDFLKGENSIFLTAFNKEMSYAEQFDSDFTCPSSDAL
jgi:hypothetical protein